MIHDYNLCYFKFCNPSKFCTKIDYTLMNILLIFVNLKPK